MNRLIVAMIAGICLATMSAWALALRRPIETLYISATGSSATGQVQDWWLDPRVEYAWTRENVAGREIVRILNGASSEVVVLTAAWSFMRRCVRNLMGRCRRCGYRLEGLEASKCPECGASIARESCAEPCR